MNQISTNQSYTQALGSLPSFTALPKLLRSERYYIVSYDMSCDKFRRKMAKTCLKYGLQRIQLSMFAGCLAEVIFKRLLRDLNTLTNDLSHTPYSKASPEDPQSMLVIYKLDQSQSWLSLNSPNAQNRFANVEDVLKPKHFSDYICM